MRRVQCVINKICNRKLLIAFTRWSKHIHNMTSVLKVETIFERLIKSRVRKIFNNWKSIISQFAIVESSIKSLFAVVRSKLVSKITSAFTRWKVWSCLKGALGQAIVRKADKFRTLSDYNHMKHVFSLWKSSLQSDMKAVGHTTLSTISNTMNTIQTIFQMTDEMLPISQLTIVVSRALEQILSDFSVEIYYAQNDSLDSLIGYVEVDQLPFDHSYYSSSNTTDNERYERTSHGYRGNISIPIGSGIVGQCAKSGVYSICYHEINKAIAISSPNNQLSPSEVRTAVAALPLIYDQSIVGVIQIKSKDLYNLNSILLEAGTDRIRNKRLNSESRSSPSRKRHFIQSTATQLFNLCLDLKLDLQNAIKLISIVSALIHAINRYIVKDFFKTELQSTMEKEMLLKSLKEEKEVANELQHKATQRVEHLEQSRLRHFKEAKRCREVK